MATKKCTKCQETKKLNEYGVDKRAFDGRRSECKRCMLVRAREYKRSLKGVSRDCLNASRRKWAATNRDKINGYNNRWVEANPEKLRELSRQKYKKDKGKYLARDAVKRAINSGSIKRGGCEICGTTERVQAHHDDYSKPLVVRWFCCQHHHDLHRNLKREPGEE